MGASQRVREVKQEARADYRSKQISFAEFKRDFTTVDLGRYNVALVVTNESEIDATVAKYKLRVDTEDKKSNVCGAYATLRICRMKGVICDLDNFPFNDAWTGTGQLASFISNHTELYCKHESFTSGNTPAWVNRIDQCINNGNPCIILIDWGKFNMHYVVVIGYKAGYKYAILDYGGIYVIDGYDRLACLGFNGWWFHDAHRIYDTI